MAQVNKYGVGLILLVLFEALSCNKPSPLTDAGWLIGTWENRTASGAVYETWTQQHPHQYLGKSYRLDGPDTVVFETIQLVGRNDSLFFIPTVNRQNEGLAVVFSSVAPASTHMTFENLEHDFPQRITYTLVHPDSLLGEVSGLQDGKEVRRFFPMQRVKE